MKTWAVKVVLEGAIFYISEAPGYSLTDDIDKAKLYRSKETACRVAAIQVETRGDNVSIVEFDLTIKSQLVFVE